MENALLIGLSRQIALQRELDVVANNIANMNTTGFKADGSLFEEFLCRLARATRSRRRRASASCRTAATWHDMSQGPIEQTGNPLDVAIDGDGFLVVQTPRGERYTRNGALQINAAGQLVTAKAIRCSATAGRSCFSRPTATSRSARTAPSGCAKAQRTADSQRGKLRLVSFANPQQLQKDGAGTFAAPDGVTPQAEAKTPRVVQGAIEKSNVRGVVEMTRMIEITRSLHADRHHAAAAERSCGTVVDRQARRSAELRRD